MLHKIKKRDGQIVPFDQDKITIAIFKAAKAVGGSDFSRAEYLSDQVVSIYEKNYRDTPTVEKIQDIVEKVLIENGHAKTAKAYILYRQQRTEVRNFQNLMLNSAKMIQEYLGGEDWRINENSNMNYSLQGLNNHIISAVTSKYWLEKVYPQNIREAHQYGDFHIHDLSLLAPYCCGWNLEDILLHGFRGAPQKVSSGPAKHFKAALGQIVNFFYTLQGEAAGAQALSSFDTYLAPFIRYDGLNYIDIKQALQEFIFNLNVPTRVGFQSPFINITFDVIVPGTLAEQPVIIHGKPQAETYGDFQEEMNLLNKAFCEIMMAGDTDGRVFTFPIPTYNVTNEFFESPILEEIMKMTTKYGIPYFANFINSELSPDDVRSMCCRLRIDHRELKKRGGGLFGANPLTGSIGVVTINLPRIGYKANTLDDYLSRLTNLAELAKESLLIKRGILEQLTKIGLYPYSRFYLDSVYKRFGRYWDNHFNTIGIIGMNESLLNFIGKDITTPAGQETALMIMDHLRKTLIRFQEETDQMFNLEATPAESTTYRLALLDRELYPEIITAGKKEPYYTNSTQLPVGYTDDLFTAIALQDKLQTKYTGGTVFHAYLGERMEDTETCRKLIKKVFTNFSLPYFSLTPSFSVCQNHGYLKGEQYECPYCQEETEVWSRVVGFYRPVQNWNKGKQEEFRERVNFKV
ncbi:MAG: ribonucleoside triphosphate reductase [Dethiobacteria bacterium]|jgi:anaerobic ribonucleoside-triphosphate reductase